MDRLPQEIHDLIYKFVDELYLEDHKKALKQVINQFMDVRKERIINFWTEVPRTNHWYLETDDAELIAEGLERFILLYDATASYMVLEANFITVVF